MLVLSRQDVETLLDLDELIEVLADAMRDLSAGRASMPPRGAALVAERQALLAAMPAFLPSARSLTTKVVSLFPENKDRPTHQAIICCFDADNGTPLAVMDGTYITAVRTAAGSALATRLLARPNAQIVCIIGTGVQAAAHARALARLGQVKKVLVVGRDASKAVSLSGELAHAGINAEAASSIEEAVRAADIVCAATHSADPVVRRAWLRPGTHVNSVGYNSAGDGEVDTGTIRDSIVVVESREAALAPPPSGAIELRRAIERGAVTANHIHAEVGELLNGHATGRTNDEQLTLYKSVGVAIQDAAAAAIVLRAATLRGIGKEVPI